MTYQQLTPILTKLRHYTENLYADRLDRLDRLILFGSQARGDAEQDSDIDILVVLKDEVDSWTEIKRTGDFISQLGLKNNILICNIFVSAQEYLEQNTALLRNIKREGMTI
ncbi:DNA polymerase beta domain protein region (plasmid) [Thalassoporum mexicanum PCC 7367]|uniref:nucleotidyltransferase domain-containing protein n=1 Tax=Thalassoporum mexicanum TaxID=3457544 RepID=UPI00029F9D1C|nr:nucleotidyltransferase domain-containing protein [Pseudanabaena sp. PCC 7367]AFY72065.1 DNA polymerase beta domain protein region [Pseudanabaena sp. PCC 7367]